MVFEYNEIKIKKKICKHACMLIYNFAMFVTNTVKIVSIYVDLLDASKQIYDFHFNTM